MVLIIGLTYNEGVSDTMATPVRGMIRKLMEFGVEVCGAGSVTDVWGNCVIVAVVHGEMGRRFVECVRTGLHE